MRKLKLQMQISIDGFVAGPNGELDWMTWVWDEKLNNYVSELNDSMDTILLGRKMTEGFISHWLSITNDPSHSDYLFAKKMIDLPKYVFSRTLKQSDWVNTQLKSETKKTIPQLKEKPGKDIIVYGGAEFVSSLINDGLIDELYLFTNPSALGKGLRIFGNTQKLKRIETRAFECGIVLNLYTPNQE